MRNGICAPRPTSEPPIGESACSSWPTTTSADANSSGSGKDGVTLTDAVSERWPTVVAGDARRGRDSYSQREGNPTLVGIVEQWPTPAQRDYRSPNSEESQERRAEGREAAGQQLPNFVAHQWATPAVPNGGRTSNTTNAREDGSKQQIDLGAQAKAWPTPRTEDGESAGNHPDKQDSLTGTTRDWPTPTATPYGSSQNGINGKGGAHERPSANTPSLEKLSRSFHRGQPTLPVGNDSLPFGQNSPQLWTTPHGMANTDTSGKTGGAGGEFHKQAMSFQPTSVNSSQSATTPTGVTTSTSADAGSRSRAKLNPLFVEWLMGLPRGWTDCGRAVTGLSLFKQRMRSSLSRLVSVRR